MMVRLTSMQAVPLWAAVLVTTGGCSGEAHTTLPSPPLVSFVTVKHIPVPVTTELPGRTSPYLVAQVRARVDGIVQQRLFAEGADVEANEVLYRIDPAPYQAALESAQAQLARARANVESTTAQAERDAVLVAANAVSRQTYLNAVAAQRQASADVAAGIAGVKAAAIELGYTTVLAPISGRIGSALVTQGAYVQGGAATLMAVIQQIDPIYVDLNETSVEGLQLRQQVASGAIKLVGPDRAVLRLELEDGSAYRHAGLLQFSDITVDTGTGSVTVRALFPNPDHILLPGMFVRARIEQGSDQRAMLIDQQGVTHDRQGRATVLILDAHNQVVLRPVIATRVLRDKWVVQSGLDEGERVIVSGLQQVQPGAVVRAQPADARSEPAAAVSPAAR
jgi:membrane fusion protein (multidrug efflux system)